MKKATLIVIFLLFGFSIHAQRNQEIVMWEVETRQAGILFGICETKDGADVVMFNFQKRNKNSDYDISDHPAKYKFTTVPVKSFDDNPVDNFKSQLGGKSYKIFPKNSIEGFENAKLKGNDALITYYLNTNKTNTIITSTAGNQTINTDGASEENNDVNTNQEIVLWEVETRIDGVLFGISKTKDNADAIMLDFQKRNANTIYDISRYPAKYKFTTINIKNSKEDPVALFKSYTKGREYKVLSAEDIKGIEIAKRKGLNEGVDYYVDVRGADKAFVKKRLNDLLTNFDEFRIKSPGDKYLATTAD